MSLTIPESEIEHTWRPPGSVCLSDRSPHPPLGLYKSIEALGSLSPNIRRQDGSLFPTGAKDRESLVAFCLRFVHSESVYSDTFSFKQWAHGPFTFNDPGNNSPDPNSPMHTLFCRALVGYMYILPCDRSLRISWDFLSSMNYIPAFLQNMPSTFMYLLYLYFNSTAWNCQKA